MITIRAGKAAIGVCLLVLAGCSREQQDWRSAEAADSIEAYDQFIQRHPESELATQARTRVAQLGEDRDWQHAGSADNVDAYRQFITQHPNGKWTQEARIRIENFSLGAQQGNGGNVGGAGSAASAGVAATAAPDAVAGSGSTRPGGSAARSAGVAAGAATAADGPRHRDGLAVPGEAAVPAGQMSASASAYAARAASPTSAATTDATVAAPGSAATPAAPSPAVPHSPPAMPAPIHSGAYGIQLGAFGSEAAANMEWHLLTGRFGPELQGLTEHVVMAETASGRIYRLQAVVGEESRARAICDSLRKSSQACVAVLPH
jgi:cell division septation protein DedD